MAPTLGSGHSDHPCCLYLRMIVKDLFHMTGKYCITFVFDEVALPVEKMEVPLVVHPDQVTRSEPFRAVDFDQ